MANPQPTPPELQEKKGELLAMFERMLPLVDGVADSIRFAMLLGLALVIWIFIWFFFLKDYSLTTALIISGLSILPVLLLLRFWWALEELKRLPDIIAGMMDDATDEVRTTVQNIRDQQTRQSGLLSSAKNLWKVGSFASEARDLAGSYISIGTLLNPFSLALGVLSLLFVLFLILVGIVLAVLAL